MNASATERRVARVWDRGRGALRFAPPTNPAPAVFVLLVDFTGTSLSQSTTTVAGFFDGVRNYYIENSYGNFTPTFTVSTSVFTLPFSLATYGANSGPLCPGQTDDVTCGVDELLADAATEVAGAGLNLTGYDHLMVFHAGAGEESTPFITNNLWSLYLPGATSIGGKTFEGFTLVPESEVLADPLGVVCHEYGHQLGLPDIYDTGTGLTTLGAWDVMDYPYMGSPPGANPPHLGAWSKIFLGFAAPPSPSTGTLLLPPSETNATGVRELFRSGSESFLAEYRLQGAAVYDADLPQPAGLLVWHIDDALALNPFMLAQNIVNAPSLNGTGRRGIDLVEADGVPAGGDVGDNDGWLNGATVASPDTDFYGGFPSSLVITGVSGVGGPSVSAIVRFISSSATEDITEARGYPNPAGRDAPRSGAPSGTIATLRVQMTRPPRESRLRLFTRTGTLIRSVDQESLVFRDDLSANNVWVFEWDWDGRDEAGEDVGSGVYFYRVSADGASIRGAIAVER